MPKSTIVFSVIVVKMDIEQVAVMVMLVLKEVFSDSRIYGCKIGLVQTPIV